MEPGSRALLHANQPGLLPSRREPASSFLPLRRMARSSAAQSPPPIHTHTPARALPQTPGAAPTPPNPWIGGGESPVAFNGSSRRRHPSLQRTGA